VLVTNDAVSSVLGAALDGLAFRQRVTADNIANVDTPGFRATSVDFESALRDAISDPGELEDGLGVVSTTTDTPVGANGNGVDLRKEALAAIQSQFQYQLLSRAVSERADLVRTTAGAA
jgi:flagellar basal-body rod protein FlgB